MYATSAQITQAKIAEEIRTKQTLAKHTATVCISEQTHRKRMTQMDRYDHICLDMIPKKNRTLDLCMKAVADYVYNLKYVPQCYQTPELFKRAFSGKKTYDYFNDNDSFYPGLYFVAKRFKTPEICELAVIQDASNFQFVPNNLKTPEMCHHAVSESPLMLKHVPKNQRTYELCKLALEGLSENFEASIFEYIPSKLKTIELCLLAIEKDKLGVIFQQIPEILKTMEVCTRAVIRTPNAIANVPEPNITIELCELAVTHHDFAIHLIPNKLRTENLARLAVEAFPHTICYVGMYNMTRPLCMYALERDINVFPLIPTEFLTEEICRKAILHNACMYSHVPRHLQTTELYALAKSKGYVMTIEELDNLEICMKYVELDGQNICRVPERFKTYELCWKALTKLINRTSDFPLIACYIPKNLIDHSMADFLVDHCGMNGFGCLPYDLRTKELSMKAMDKELHNGYFSYYILDRLKQIPRHIRTIEFHLFCLNKLPDYFCYLPNWIKYLIKSRLLQSSYIKRKTEINSKPMRGLPVYQVIGNKDLQEYIFAFL